MSPALPGKAGAAVPSLVVAGILSIVSLYAPGDGLALLPETAAQSRSPSRPVVPGVPGSPVGGGVAVVAGALAAVRPARRRDGMREQGGFPDDMVLVVVPGHGSPAAGTFDDLVGSMGVPQDRVAVFDWRWLEPGATHEHASQTAATADAADVLEAYLAGLSHREERIYLVGHSKGGAVIAELVARWDDEPGRVPGEVIGAALLDPPIADGILGALQRAGGIVPHIPDNGGYSPTECGLWSCRDRREHLGDKAGVDVLVVRNTDAVVTSFHDEPRGLRVYDLEADGAGSALGRFGDGGVFARIREAHRSPLHHPAVAACLSHEVGAPGSCRWTAGAVHDGLPPRRVEALWGTGGLLGKSLR